MNKTIFSCESPQGPEKFEIMKSRINPIWSLVESCQSRIFSTSLVFITSRIFAICRKTKVEFSRRDIIPVFDL